MGFMPMHSDEFKLINIEQGATILGVSTKTLRRMIKEGQIPALKVGNQWRIRKSRLQRWIQQQENNGYSGEAVARKVIF